MTSSYLVGARTGRVPIRFNLFQTHRHPGNCSRQFSADLRAAELQDHAIGVLQLNASSARCYGTAGSNRAVSAFD